MGSKKNEISETVDALHNLGVDASKQIAKEVKKQRKKDKRRGRLGKIGFLGVLAALVMLIFSGLGFGFGGGGNGMFGGKGNGTSDKENTSFAKVDKKDTTKNDTQAVKDKKDDAKESTGGTKGGFPDGKLKITVNKKDIYFGEDKLASVDELSKRLAAIDKNKLPEVTLVDDYAVISVYDQVEEALKKQSIPYIGD